MKKTGLTFLVCLLAPLTLVFSSHAATGPYVSGQLGLTSVQDADNTQLGDTIETSYDLGFNVGAAGGYDFGPARLEGEFTYRQNDVDEFGIPGLGSFAGDGDVSALSFMINGFWDIPVRGPVTPYLGGGIGVAQVSLNDVSVMGFPFADDDDTVFAYQLGAGAAFELSQSWALDLGYRYFATSDPEFSDADGVTFDSEYQSHNLSLGIRFSF